LDVIDDAYDVLDIKAGDSDVDSDDEDDLSPSEVILEAKVCNIALLLPSTQ